MKQREIKFRVWYPCGDKGEMVNDVWIDLEMGELFADNDALCEREGHSGAILMQFTGLSDKNGKEIYEGDIVRFYFDADYGYDKKRGTEMIDTVEFEEGIFYFMNANIGSGAYANRHNKYCEIIGNIYEDKNLLK